MTTVRGDVFKKLYFEPLKRGWLVEFDSLREMGSKFFLGNTKVIDFVGDIAEGGKRAIMSIKSLNLDAIRASDKESLTRVLTGYIEKFRNLETVDVKQYWLKGAKQGELFNSFTLGKKNIGERILQLNVNKVPAQFQSDVSQTLQRQVQPSGVTLKLRIYH